jgi:hypothetical protein
MNLSTALVLSSAILGGSLLVSNLESQMTTPPAIESHAAAATPDITPPTPDVAVVSAVAPSHRYLTSEEILVLYFTHQAAIEAASEGSDASMRTHVEAWLADNAKHDPRSPEYVATPVPELPAPGGEEVIDELPKASPVLYTQPAPVAKPKAAPRPVVRYYYVTPRQQGGCSNGSCGSGGRRGLFGRRR